MERIKKLGEINFLYYLKDLNNLPSERIVGERFKGRKTLLDSFIFQDKEEDEKNEYISEYIKELRNERY